ncbi:sulfatase family protein [Galbibacter mesophilus]|uniref:sulfatase family protein n=1 Tax=Galbibacter mesophilus TaxID=379069 RepID=UPI00191F9C45|nr:sulfatase [Galbibacter mesophilus]MCM5663073.1 sulfatase [Galbibacter mesophilus]
MKKIVLFFYILFLQFVFSQEKPNFLFVILDDAGLDMGAYNSTYVNTPAFDRVAKNGILFTNAYTPNAKCAPSRACILTGRNPWQLDAAANHNIYFPSKFKTYQDILQENGYSTGYTGKGYAPGIALDAEGNQRELTGKPYNDKKTTPPTPAISKIDYAGNFSLLLNDVDAEKPWSFWVGMYEPHRYYEYESGKKLGSKSVEMITDFPPYWRKNEVTQNDLLDYAFEIEYADKQLAEIIELLKKNGEYENTVIVVTSDHGMPFPRVKGNLYEKAIHVPLAISWEAGITDKNRKVNSMISFIDLAPTFLEMAQINEKESGMQPITGKSMLPLLKSSDSSLESKKDWVLIGKERHDTGRPNDVGYPIRGIVKDSMLYLKNYEINRWPSGNPETGYLNTDGSPTKTEILQLRRTSENSEFWQINFGKRPEEELYNIKKDPFCMVNLANEKTFQSTKINLRSFMEEKLVEQNDLRMKNYGYIYERYPLFSGRNFYIDYIKGKKPKAGWVNDSDFEEFYVNDEGENLKKVFQNEN